MSLLLLLNQTPATQIPTAIVGGGVTAGSIVNLFRIYTAEYDSLGRWSDADALALINEAQNFVSLLLEWPVAHFVAAPPNGTQVGVMEYTLPEIVKIERVYVQGQPAVPTDKATLEGTNIGFFDQTNPTTLYTPNWNAQPNAVYPVVNVAMGYPQGVSPYYIGKRPCYYIDGGNIGIIPPPAGAYTLDIWGIGVPQQFQTLADICDFPSFFQYALAHKAAEIALDADTKPEAAQKQGLKFAEWLPQLRAWKYDLVKNRSRGPRPTTYRHFYKQGRSRRRSWD